MNANSCTSLIGVMLLTEKIDKFRKWFREFNNIIQTFVSMCENIDLYKVKRLNRSAVTRETVSYDDNFH